MNKLLHPDSFNGSLDTTPAEWNHWFRTFTNFLDSISDDTAPDKLKLLVNHVSPPVFSHISDCNTYKEAITMLETVYVKPTIIIFTRHLLATRKQTNSETVDQFLHALKLLCSDYEFRAVSADTYIQEAIRDAFISGISSPMIRQRLLEKESLTLSKAMQLARSLDSAQRNAEVYVVPAPNDHLSAATEFPQTSATASHGSRTGALNLHFDDLEAGEPLDNSVAATSKVTSKFACYFCGKPSHPRFRCPARNTVCYTCRKKGHFANVCRSTREATKCYSTSASTTVLATMAAAGPIKTP
ncbi:hypothetical protein E2C01_025048 [Portunus trituberculatus]|uniref:CCHC-type domain-containing protein n=1 Tax=Portunus trituberculatus TaxID=210409 RepID=A0A5B7EC97_PORTR|nr:hypothetical protein [Portunus trituberculatus]